MAFLDYLNAGSNLVGAAGDVYSALQKPPGGAQVNPSLGGFRGLVSTPGYNFGAGHLTRRSDAFAKGLQGYRGELAALKSQVRPGFGRLTDEGVKAIRQKAAEASGNLRAQLARRGLAGASFASDLQTRLDAEYNQMEQQFRAQAFNDEMAQTADLLDRDLQATIASADLEFKELGLSTAYLSSVKQAALNQKAVAQATAQAELVKKFGMGKN